jgi:hypothetical protein
MAKPALARVAPGVREGTRMIYVAPVAAEGSIEINGGFIGSMVQGSPRRLPPDNPMTRKSKSA